MTLTVSYHFSTVIRYQNHILWISDEFAGDVLTISYATFIFDTNHVILFAYF